MARRRSRAGVEANLSGRLKVRALFVVLALGCAGAAERDAIWERHAAALNGRWTVRFTYSGAAVVAAGTMELTPNRTIDHAYPRIGIPTNYGTYGVAFRDLGGSPSGDRVPAVAAGFAGDSLFVLFETDREGFSMRMRGVLAGDSARGAWAAMQSRGTIASGTFTMTRY